MANIHSNIPPKGPTKSPHSHAQIMRQQTILAICTQLHHANTHIDYTFGLATTLHDPDGRGLARALDRINDQITAVLTLLQE